MKNHQSHQQEIFNEYNDPWALLPEPVYLEAL